MTTTHPRVLSRRSFLGTAAVTAATVAASPWVLLRAQAAASSITLPPLPYEPNALEPVISSRTVEIHYGKHHRGYIRKTNQKIAGTALQGASLETIIRKTSADTAGKDLFNVAAQAWNHNFYWQSLRPRGGGKPPARLNEALAGAFGDVAQFKTKFIAAAASLFGSGWAWLVAEPSGLRIMTTSNADTPLAHGKKPLLVVDVWEHAYYLDYQNRRKAYLEAVMDKLINWEFALKNLETA